jgi:serine/threonine-protein kinase
VEDRRIDTHVGGYRIVEPIGRGGTSIVYRAEHVRLGRPAALKLLTPALGEADFTDRFLRESRLAASLDHPSIVPVYDAGEADEVLYIAMQHIDGSDLKALLVAEGRLPLRRAIRIVSQIASALDAAHARGLVHRDVKPANILVGTNDRAYLSDFGVVKELASGGRTRTGGFVGTIDYCAPEQIEGREVDARADVYALACVFYECVVGVSPFRRSSDVATLNAHLHTPPPRLSKAAPDLPPALEPVLAKALAKSPLDRYASCGELVGALRAAVAERRVHPRRLALSLAILGAAAALGAAVAAALFLSLRHDPSPRVTTVVRTQRISSPDGLDSFLLRTKNAAALNDAAYFLITDREYVRALPLARRAVQYSAKNSVTYGYASFNYGVTLVEVGRCAEALPLLRRALRVEAPAQHKIIAPWVTRAVACSRGGASAPGR